VIVLDIADRRWVEFVESCEAATPFHHPAWTKLIAECYRYRAFALARPGADQQIVAGLPVIEVRRLRGRRRWLSLAFTDRCPPLQQCEASIGGLAEELEATRREAGVAQLEVRDDLAEVEAHREVQAVMHYLSLQRDLDAVYRGFKRPVRKGIERANGNGIVIRHDTSRLGLTHTFYALHVQTRRRLGVPVQPRRYFDLLWQRMVEPGRGFVVLAYHKGMPIAGAVFLAWNGTITYKYGASNTRYWDLHPNHLVLWTAIQWGCAHDFHTFDFGRSDLSSKGLRQFKSGWGKEQNLTYTTLGGYIRNARSGRLQETASAVIRRSPPWVCRAIGGLLYRYAA
jgi:CelD/BcsL family acetyltransferase involved in cellulose biosynthesis